MRFTFKPARENQRTLIQNWIAQDHIKEWLHGQGLQNLLVSLDMFFKGDSWNAHWIAYDKETPFAYLLTSDESENTIALDMFICDLNYLGKGLAVQLIQEFLLSQFPNKKEVTIDPEATNTRAIHVYEKAGFRITDEFIAKWHPVLHYKMRLDMQQLH